MQTGDKKMVDNISPDVLGWTQEYDSSGSRYFVLGTLTTKPEEGIVYEEDMWEYWFDKGLYLIPDVNTSYSLAKLNSHLDYARRMAWNHIGKCIADYLDSMFQNLIIVQKIKKDVEIVIEKGEELSKVELRSLIEKMCLSNEVYVDRSVLVDHLHTLIRNFRVFGPARMWSLFCPIRIGNVKIIRDAERKLWGGLLYCQSKRFWNKDELLRACVEPNPGPYSIRFSIKNKLVLEGIESNPGPVTGDKYKKKQKRNGNVRRGKHGDKEEFDVSLLPADFQSKLINPKLDWYATPMRSGSVLYTTHVCVLRNEVFKGQFYVPYRKDVNHVELINGSLPDWDAVPNTIKGNRKITSRSTVLHVEWDSNAHNSELSIQLGSSKYLFSNLGKVRVEVSIGTHVSIYCDPPPSNVWAEFKNFCLVRKPPNEMVRKNTRSNKMLVSSKTKKFVKEFNAIKGNPISKPKNNGKKQLNPNQIARRRAKNAKRKMKKASRTKSENLVPFG
jgi:hypothetical protein